jgi:hypothetical protein
MRAAATLDIHSHSSAVTNATSIDMDWTALAVQIQLPALSTGPVTTCAREMGVQLSRKRDSKKRHRQASYRKSVSQHSPNSFTGPRQQNPFASLTPTQRARGTGCSVAQSGPSQPRRHKHTPSEEQSPRPFRAPGHWDVKLHATGQSILSHFCKNDSTSTKKQATQEHRPGT